MPNFDSEVRDAILDSAERLFARNGLQSTKTEAIANDAGVSKALIYYYFKTKGGLYRSVFARMREERERGLDFAALAAIPPMDALEQHLTRLLQQMSEKPHTVSLFALENIQNRGHYYAGPAASMAVLVTIIERGIESGVFRRVDPRHAALNVMGSCLHYFNVMHSVKKMWPSTKTQAVLTQEHAACVLDFARAALCQEQPRAGSSRGHRSRVAKPHAAREARRPR